MIKKMGITQLIFELQEHKAKIRGDLRGYVVRAVASMRQIEALASVIFRDFFK